MTADEDEDAFLRRLGAGRQDPLPAEVDTAARQAFAQRSTGARMTAASYDSMLDRGLAAARSGPLPRRLTYSRGGVELELEVSHDGGKLCVEGHVSPACPARVVVRHGGSEESGVQADELGRFVLADLLTGPMSVQCTGSDGRLLLRTDWVLV